MEELKMIHDALMSARTAKVAYFEVAARLDERSQECVAGTELDAVAQARDCALGELNRAWREVHEHAWPWCVRRAEQMLKEGRAGLADAAFVASKALRILFERVERTQGIQSPVTVGTLLGVIMARWCVPR